VPACPEITHLHGARFAVLERDNQSGSYAVIKSVTVISLEGVTPAAWGELPLVEKQRAIDLLPAMQAGRGWISDKPEGLAVAADGQVLTIIDNGGVSDASGETLLLRLGAKEALFRALRIREARHRRPRGGGPGTRRLLHRAPGRVLPCGCPISRP